MRAKATEEEVASAMTSPKSVPSVLYRCGLEPVDFYGGLCVCACM